MNHPEAGCPARTTPHASRLTLHAFTLVEMIVVTGIIAVLAALIFPVTAAVRKARDLKRTQTELTQVASAIQGYFDKLGHYPPDSTLATDALRYQHNPLFYELRGTSNNVQTATFYALDGSTSIAASALPTAFGIDGFINCLRPGRTDEAQPAIKFLSELKAGQFVDTPVNGPTCRLLGCALDGRNSVQDPVTNRKFTPFWYNCSSPTNNAKSFDLWVDIQIGNKIYRVNNWSSTAEVYPAP